MRSGWRDGKSPTRTTREAPSATPARAAPPQGKPGRLKVETGRPQVQHGSGYCIPPPAPLRHRVTAVPAPGGTELSPSLCARSPPLLAALPGSARPAPPALVPVPRWAADAVRSGPGRAGARGRCWLLRLLSSLVCPRVAGEVAGAEWGRRNESRASPYFSPAPLFLSQHFRTIPPTRSLLPPPLVAGAGLSPSPCLRLPRPFPAPPSPLGARRAGRQRSPSPPRGACPCMRVPQPSSSCLRQPGVLVPCRGGKEGRLSARRCILQSLPCLSSGVNVCARGNLCNHGFLKKGEGVGERSASSALSPSRRSLLIP